MLNLRRRHLKTCKHRSSLYLKCQCPLWAIGTLNGKFVRRALDTRNQEKAILLIREMEVGGESVLLSVACSRFISDARIRALSADTIKKLERLTTELQDYFPAQALRPINTDDLAKFRETWKVKASTGKKKLERLKSFFNFCMQRGWIQINPAKGLRPPKESVIEVKPFTSEELEKISWAIPLFTRTDIPRLKAFIAILRWTGLRIRDVVQLKSDRIVDGSIILRTHKNQKPIKLPLHQEAIDALKELSGEYFFWSGEGNPKSCVGDWQRTLRRLSALSGVHVHAHRFRHTFATELLAKGVPVSEVSAILGNTVAIVEKHYSQWISSRQDALNVAVKKAWA